jgi:hypothetical protein
MPIAVHSHLYSFALRSLFLQTHATSYSFYSSVTPDMSDAWPEGLLSCKEKIVGQWQRHLYVIFFFWGGGRKLFDIAAVERMGL